MADRSGSTAPHELQQALLQYAAAPGKYSVKLRQPAVLYAGITEVLQLASLRQAPDDRQAAALVAAARFFVATALLHPEADHHAVLGANESTPAGVVKERYRLLMRLLHPDFARGQAEFPADAAARVNRAYDYVSSGSPAPAAPSAAPVPAERPARPLPPRRAAPGAAAHWNLPKSRLKHAFFTLGFIGVALMLLLLSMDRQGPVQLVQKPPPPKPVALETPTATSPPPPEPSLGRSLGTTLSDLLADLSGSSSLQLSRELTPTTSVHPASTPRSRPVTPVAVAERPAPRPATHITVIEEIVPAPPQIVAANVPPARQDLPADLPPPVAAAAPVAAPEPVRTAAVAPARAEPTPPALPVAAAPLRPGLTLIEAQPLLAVLLQHMETGRSERVLGMLEPDARMRPGAQSFSRQYDSVVDGARVRLSQVQFRAEPADGKLVVVGQMRLQFPDLPIHTAPRRFSVQAEFVNRNGTVVLTSLSGGPLN